MSGVRSSAGRWFSAARVVREVLLLGGLYVAYTVVRGLVDDEAPAAVNRGMALLKLEAEWGLDVEYGLNQLVSGALPLALVSSYVYATLHFLVTPVVLGWLFVRHAGAYTIARTSLMVSTALGLVGFAVVPMAPPRLLPGQGFEDTMARLADYGWWTNAGSAARGMEGLANQYAAFPSIHVAWAVWVALVVVRTAQRTWIKAVAVAYPIVVTAVVVVTANHYLLDAVAGAVLVVGCDALVRRIVRWRRRRVAEPA